MRTTRPLLAAAAIGGLLLAGCGTNGSDTSQPEREAEPPVTTVETPDATDAAPTTQPPAEEAPTAEAPMASGCERLDEADDGFYRFEAGEVTMRHADGRLTLDDVRPAEGWTHRVDDQDDDEIEIDFRRDRREVDFEAELDDGRLEIEVCVDQDD